jgi:hypothetical protein
MSSSRSAEAPGGAVTAFAAIVVLVSAFACAYGDSSADAGVPAGKSHAAERAADVDPYKAALAFSDCMRRQGLPYPRPNRAGNFELTPRQEQRLLRFSRAKREAAEKACFHHLRPVVSTKPLSSRAKALAKQALRRFAGCMRAEGFDLYSDPVVKNMSRGRAFFGFERTKPAIRRVERTQKFLKARTLCERKLRARLDRIVADDRGGWVP